ncbi:MAG: zinc-dependent metalloprotease [Phycisphaeraceae bacterium]|nr:zinc-dependent metalloprotease [Phycisphaeraceae bacterium]
MALSRATSFAALALLFGSITIASSAQFSSGETSQTPPGAPSGAAAGGAPGAPGAPGADKPEFPPFDQVIKGLEKVVSPSTDGTPSLYTLYIDKKKNRLLAELPAQFANQRIFIATSISGGSRQTGHQWNDLYGYWRQQDNKLLLMEPNLLRQARGGDQERELRSSVQRTYTDRVVTSVPILCMGPGRGPVINLGELLVGQMPLFTNIRGRGELAELGNVKAFPQNLEIPITVPTGDGQLTKIHYSISVIPKTDYKPREADERIGYFLTVYKDFSKNDPDGTQFTRYINRWHLQKRDPSLAMSPPTEPIVFYIEHTVPVRYRRWVRDGILEWNAAFEKVGILNALEVRQQDAQTKAFMDLDPEDVRYNFFRWITSETPFAMGPSRVNPETGQILDADIIFDDSMLKLYRQEYERSIAAYGLDGVSPEAISFMESRPLWNPLAMAKQVNPMREAVLSDPHLSDDQKADLVGDPTIGRNEGLYSRVVQQNRYCSYAAGKAMQMEMASLAMTMMPDLAQDGPQLDGVPESYLGLILKEIVMHEVGHTLGLRHNFKASAWKSLDEYADAAGEASVGSVMDYNPIRVTVDGKPRGDWVPSTIGPYDFWAIEYGYSFDEKRVKEMANESMKAEYQFATDEDTLGPDPLVARFDLSSDPLAWAEERMEVVKAARAKMLDKAVKDGESWHLLRRAYETLLGQQLGALRTASRYVGGVHVNRDRKGGEGRDPLVPVDAAKQREALAFLIANSFPDSAFDLRPEVVRKLSTNKHRHWGALGDFDEAFSLHDRIGQVQSFVLLYLMNPRTLTQVFDNELRKPGDEDALTLPEVFRTVIDAGFTEIQTPPEGKFTSREPMVSSLRRNLQDGLTTRLIDLMVNPPRSMPRAVQTLASMHLRQLSEKLDALSERAASGELDDYTAAHVSDLKTRVDKALNSVMIRTPG